MGPRAMTWQQEVTSVSVTKNGGELGVTIQEIVMTLKIVALIPIFVMVMGSVFGMKAFEHITLDVIVIPVGKRTKTVSVPRGRSTALNMRAPGTLSVQILVFVTMYSELT